MTTKGNLSDCSLQFEQSEQFNKSTTYDFFKNTRELDGLSKNPMNGQATEDSNVKNVPVNPLLAQVDWRNVGGIQVPVLLINTEANTKLAQRKFAYHINKIWELLAEEGDSAIPEGIKGTEDQSPINGVRLMCAYARPPLERQKFYGSCGDVRNGKSGTKVIKKVQKILEPNSAAKGPKKRLKPRPSCSQQPLDMNPPLSLPPTQNFGIGGPGSFFPVQHVSALTKPPLVIVAPRSDGLPIPQFQTQPNVIDPLALTSQSYTRIPTNEELRLLNQLEKSLPTSQSAM